jgi:hypothetical protein
MRTLRNFIAIALLAAAGCGSAYDGIDIFVIGGDRRAEVSPGGVRIGEGGVVVIEARPSADPDHEDFNALDEFELKMSDVRVANVRRGVLTHSFVINGADPGDTTLQVRVNDVLEQVIPVRVERQP